MSQGAAPRRPEGGPGHETQTQRCPARTQRTGHRWPDEEPYLGATSTFIVPCLSETTRSVVPVLGGSTPYQPGW
jgi:hypothetical protein